MSESQEGGLFPWHLGVFDAHCHPTDTMASINDVPNMKTQGLTIMATRSQDQDLVGRFVTELSSHSSNRREQEKLLIPSFGWHPWFSHHVYDDLTLPRQQCVSRRTHYRSIINPVPDDEAFLASLPEPRSLSGLLQEIRCNLERYPTALVGEIGLDRAFRIPGTQPMEDHKQDSGITPGRREGKRLSPFHVDMEHQRRILTVQLNLAGELQRAVSVHGVAAHGIVHDTLSQSWSGYERSFPSQRNRKRMASVSNAHDHEDLKSHDEGCATTRKPFPPRICLHSYSGPPDTLRQYLQPSVPATVFFSFSRLVNFSPSSSNKVSDVIKAVPDDRILAESDLHAAGKKMDDLMEDIVRIICRIKGWSLTHGVDQLSTNWRHFIFGKQ